MNIDQYIHTVWMELNKLEQLVRSVNDIMEARIDSNLKHVNRIMLIDLPEEAPELFFEFCVEDPTCEVGQFCEHQPETLTSRIPKEKDPLSTQIEET